MSEHASPPQSRRPSRHAAAVADVETPLRELLEQTKPDALVLTCWIAVLQDHLESLQKIGYAESGLEVRSRVIDCDDHESAKQSGGSQDSKTGLISEAQPPDERNTLQASPAVIGRSCETYSPGDQIAQASPTEDVPPSRTSRGQAHRLPVMITIAITLVIPLAVAVTNNFIVWTDGYLLEMKFETVQTMMIEDGFGFGVAAFTAINCSISLLTGCLVCLISPMCAGSGLPEAKSYLNGNYIRGLFTVRVFVVRVLGIILSIAAGFPIGREGPMVAIGGCVGYGVVHVLALPWFRQWVKVDSSNMAQNAALLVDEERFAHAKRIGFTLGGAAGIATAFDAPVGGILYMFEEATLSTWPPELTFRAFACTLCACLISMGMFNLIGHDVHRLLVYMDAAEYSGSWDWLDVPFFVSLAAFVGLLSALFTRLLVAVWSYRQRKHKQLQRWQPYVKILEVTAYACMCSLFFTLVPLVVGCVGDEVQAVTEGTVDESLQFVQHACSEGKINEVATLLLKGTEGSLKHLFSRNTEAFHPPSLAVTLCLYLTLNAGMAGIAVPMGNFIPSMLIGALVGRFVGEIIKAQDSFGFLHLADAGVYAMVGSAAMLGGFTQMTIAVVVILAEAAQDLSLVSPLMLSISVSHIVSTCVNQHSYDEVLILRKNVPFLEPELPSEMICHQAADLCEALPSEALLPPEAPVATVQRALERWEVVHFPVISDGVCIGLTSRARLEAAMRARGAHRSKDELTQKVLDDEMDERSDTSAARLSEDEIHVFNYGQFRKDEDVDVDEFIHDIAGFNSPSSKAQAGDGCSTDRFLPESMLPVHRLMDSAPYTLLEEMPAPRLYPLFTMTGTSAACVVSSRGEFRGLLSRVNLISAASHQWRPPRKARRSASKYEPLS